ncbi:MAG TPA: multicopper oxidase domain-containing protein [Candidatus Eisenbacteria bacterium]|nr:multicopper oxidase domain-containing protein [Candidatus Eisenbacteria bacterium]
MQFRVMDWTRREFLRNSGLLLGGLAAGQGNAHRTGIIARPQLNLAAVERFVDPLPIPSLAKPAGRRPNPEDLKTSLPYYRIALRQLDYKVHRDLMPTRMWAYGGSFPGPTLETRSGEGMLVEWVNDLPTTHFLPIDYTVHGADKNKPQVRIVTHLHGGKVPPHSDGYPEDWYVPGKSATYFYPNQQDAAALWYHDHALGITRLNVYAGLAGNYFVRDAFEDGLNLPKGKYEIPLMIVDRSFDSQHQLYYPVSPDPESPWIPDLFCDALLINGKLFPYLDVEPRKYRFRLLNASNGRMMHLELSNGQEFIQIGTDLGLLEAPVTLKRLTVAPAERMDLILDFSGHAGEKIVLQGDALTAMQFRVAKTGMVDTSSLPKSLRTVERIPESASVQNRILTLGEKDDRAGNPMTMLLNNAHWGMPVTETPKLDSVEVWSLLNFTDDTHPIHLHLVRFQILDRQPFEAEDYYKTGKIRHIGGVVKPAANEMGWKDTAQAFPGMVTRIITKFSGYPGRFVWHCHLLEHEDNEMMRPYDVVKP